jgi:hypothetical protein
MGDRDIYYNVSSDSDLRNLYHRWETLSARVNQMCNNFEDYSLNQFWDLLYDVDKFYNEWSTYNIFNHIWGHHSFSDSSYSAYEMDERCQKALKMISGFIIFKRRNNV